jgi:hypothetical protein
MATYDSGFIYDDGNIYDTTGGPTPVTPSNPDAGTISISPPSKIVIEEGVWNINGVFTFARVDETDINTGDSISQTYESDDRSLANVESPTTLVGTQSGGVKDNTGTDVTLQQDILVEPITIPNAGSRFMR